MNNAVSLNGLPLNFVNHNFRVRVLVRQGEVQTVGQATNHYILWPRRLLKLISDKEIPESNVQPQQPTPQVYPPQQLAPQVDSPTRLCMVSMNIRNQPLKIDMDPDVTGKPKNIPLCIQQKDIMELIMGNIMLSISVLQL
ncbi:hypothetical protein SESBI_32573 [Sesbania bispinosa]|nr:hypothetical protein SESBI_32573 [Sesbania bispinosa]